MMKLIGWTYHRTDALVILASSSIILSTLFVGGGLAQQLSGQSVEACLNQLNPCLKFVQKGGTSNSNGYGNINGNSNSNGNGNSNGYGNGNGNGNSNSNGNDNGNSSGNGNGNGISNSNSNGSGISNSNGNGYGNGNGGNSNGYGSGNSNGYGNGNGNGNGNSNSNRNNNGRDDNEQQGSDPDSSCCDPLKQVIKSNPECLCSMISNEGTKVAESAGINVSLAQELPGRCGQHVNLISSCLSTASTTSTASGATSNSRNSDVSTNSAANSYRSIFQRPSALKIGMAASSMLFFFCLFCV